MAYEYPTLVRNGERLPVAANEEMKEGVSESLNLNPRKPINHPRITSNRESREYMRFLGRVIRGKNGYAA